MDNQTADPLPKGSIKINFQNNIYTKYRSSRGFHYFKETGNAHNKIKMSWEETKELIDAGKIEAEVANFGSTTNRRIYSERSETITTVTTTTTTTTTARIRENLEQELSKVEKRIRDKTFRSDLPTPFRKDLDAKRRANQVRKLLNKTKKHSKQFNIS